MKRKEITELGNLKVNDRFFKLTDRSKNVFQVIQFNEKTVSCILGSKYDIKNKLTYNPISDCVKLKKELKVVFLRNTDEAR